MFYGTPAYCSSRFEWDRFRFAVNISTSEIFTDNVFLSHADTRSDYITTLSPDLRLDFALATRNILSLGYEGDYRIHANYTNFRTDFHKPSLRWAWVLPRGSKIEAGTRAYFAAYQPYSPQDEKKDYTEKETYLNTLLKAGAFSDIGLHYGHLSRRFDENAYQVNDFDSDSFRIDLAYNRFDFGSPVFEYTYYAQNNNERLDRQTDFTSHTFLLGLKWAPTSRLSGSIKGGYLEANFEDSSNYAGFTVDIDLAYRYSDFTKFTVLSFRRISRSNTAARQTGIYFVETGAGLSAAYNRFDPLKITAALYYTVDDFEQEVGIGPSRKDKHCIFRTEGQYDLREWLSLHLGYQYKQNDSNHQSVDYKENQVFFRIKATF